MMTTSSIQNKGSRETIMCTLMSVRDVGLATVRLIVQIWSDEIRAEAVQRLALS